MRKKFARYCVVVLCVIAILFALIKVLSPNKKLDTYLVMGDYLSVSGKLKGEEIISFTSLLGEYFVANDLVRKVNNNYASSSIDSSMLLEMISKDAYSGEDLGLVSLIKESKYITISVGMNDILKYIRYDSLNKKMIYDKEILERKLEIMKQNYYEIIETIKEFNDSVCVYLISYYYPFELDDDSNEVFRLLNDSIKDVSEATNVNYVDVSDVASVDNMVNKNQIYLNNKGQMQIFSNIKDLYFVDK